LIDNLHILDHFNLNDFILLKPIGLKSIIGIVILIKLDYIIDNRIVFTYTHAGVIGQNLEGKI